MCTCVQKSKTLAGSSGDFNYVFTCTADDGIIKTINVTAGNDNKAKQLAELQCSQDQVPDHDKVGPFELPQDDHEVTIVAYVEKDKTFYFIYPNPCKELFYKVHKKDVVSISRSSSANCGLGPLRPLFLVCFKITGVLETIEIGSTYSKEDIIAKSKFTALTLNANIAFFGSGEGTISFNGKNYPCLGNPTVKYPTDLTVTTGDKYPKKYSNEYQVWMEFAILIWGQRGIYIHLGADTIASNGDVSAGCIHVGDGHIQEFYNWITGNTRIQIRYPW